jgi:hypothetical protein
VETMFTRLHEPRTITALSGGHRDDFHKVSPHWSGNSPPPSLSISTCVSSECRVGTDIRTTCIMNRAWVMILT